MKQRTKQQTEAFNKVREKFSSLTDAYIWAVLEAQNCDADLALEHIKLQLRPRRSGGGNGGGPDLSL